MIEGSVAEILSQYEVVMNRGEQDGVRHDMDFIIYSIGEEIEDPDTGESLGNVEHLKARVKPRHIQTALTILETDETTTTSNSLSGLNALAGLNTEKQVPKSIANRPEDSVDSTVHIGDLVRQTNFD